jgi:hypothetical protein
MWQGCMMRDRGAIGPTHDIIPPRDDLLDGCAECVNNWANAAPRRVGR